MRLLPGRHKTYQLRRAQKTMPYRASLMKPPIPSSAADPVGLCASVQQGGPHRAAVSRSHTGIETAAPTALASPEACLLTLMYMLCVQAQLVHAHHTGLCSNDGVLGTHVCFAGSCCHTLRGRCIARTKAAAAVATAAATAHSHEHASTTAGAPTPRPLWWLSAVGRSPPPAGPRWPESCRQCTWLVCRSTLGPGPQRARSRCC